jgi:AraC-like DNA-binding protein
VTWELYEVCLLMCVVQLVLLATILARDRRGDPGVGASLVLIAAVIDHVLVPILSAKGAPATLLQPALFLDGTVPLAFWWLARVHFDDDFRVRPLHVAVLAAFVALRCVPSVVPELRYALWPLLPRVISLGFVAQALIHVHLGARSDLVLSRIQARHASLWLVGTYLVFELLAEIFLSRLVKVTTAETVHAASAALLIFVVCVIMLRMQEVLRPAKAAEPPPALDPALADRLQHLVEVEHVFLQEGLTIAVLADRLGVHEYKVRQLINSRLGFKNFNAFLHHYRIAEARLRLGDPASAHLGIAQIAYDVGYRSLGPFNKAFKELVGQTPTEFRASLSTPAPSAGPLAPAKSS